MYSLIEKIRKGKLWDFAGGVHPPGRKAMSMTTAINHIDWPEQLFLATKQHSGIAGILLVQEGEYVLKGQPLTAADMVNQVPIHAPTSGLITAIGEHVSAHPSGLPEQTVVLTPDGKHQWRVQQPIEDYRELSRQQLTERIQQAGISGLGGAGFPTHRKLSADEGVEFLGSMIYNDDMFSGFA